MRGEMQWLRNRRNIIIGERYGSLVVIKDTGDRTTYGGKLFYCRCDCGTEIIKSTRYLLRKESITKSCGCCRGKAQIKYGQSKTKESRLYRIWIAMKWRCNEKNNGQKTYRESNITCCEEWANDFVVFRDWSLNNGYGDKLSIDRIDNSKGYSPENCRWADNYTQANNKSNNTIITVGAESKTMAEWAKEKTSITAH